MNSIKSWSIAGLLLLSSCVSKEPAEVNLHTDQCAHCMMVILDEKFASQLVTDKGKAYLFDAVECLAAFSADKQDLSANGNLYVSDYGNQGEWLRIDQAAFYHSKEIKSPMGMSLIALNKSADPQQYMNEYERMNWDEVKNFVQSKSNGMGMTH